MVHELDTVAATARCVDLPGTGSFDAASTWALVADPDGRTLWATSPGYRRIVAVDVARHTVRRSWRFDAGGWLANPGLAVMSPDGAHLAVSDAVHVWFVTLTSQLSVHRIAHTAVALGYSPDQRRLWVVGERSRVSSLRPGR
jgi:hypothetical protein